ncbi:MAG: cell wall-binding repeat-containing protein [Oscillospiraceae bacterium]|nr:cell wall-binding repeat-containing protein [Oscillospiraceae bacterium]
MYAAPDDVINFPDANLKAELIRYGVDINGDGKITQSEMAGVKNDINLCEEDIVNIDGLQYLVNVTNLNLSSNKITDISPLANLVNLEWLYLHENQISDISPLASITNLIAVSLEENQISDITPQIANLMNLASIGLGGNQIRDISPLANLPRLEQLGLTNTQISDISPLINFVGNLTDLDLGHNQISDIAPLSNFANLSWLTLNDNQINDITPIAGLTKLENLILSDNQITDTSPLSNLTNLSSLFLANNKIRDISPLANLTDLAYLNLDNNQISDISFVSNFSRLIILALANNKIRDISSIAKLTDLNDLYLSNNYIDVNENSTSMQIIDNFKKKGTYVEYQPQKNSSEIFNENATRFSGSSRTETALNIATQGWPTGAETVILTSGRGFADALAGGSLSAALDAPLLLTSNLPTGLEDDVLNTIKDLKAKNVIILGGTGTVSTDIEEALKAQGLDVERRSGGNRYETAVDIATALYENTEFDTVFLADGNNYPDALAGAPVSGILGQPILFTNSKDKNVREETLNFIEENGIKNVVILGGSSSVSDEVKKALEDKNIEVSRISGGNRYETALNIYNAYKDIFTGDTITITTGTNFPDALAGSAYSAKIGAPLFLLANTLNNANIRTAITSSGKEDFLVYGGSGSLSNAAVLRHVL